MLYLVNYTLKWNGQEKKFSEYWRIFQRPTASFVYSHWTYIANMSPEVSNFSCMPACENINVKTIVEV